MAMPVSHSVRRNWTADQVRTLPPDNNRYEVIDGELLVSPAPGWRHQLACWTLFRLVDGFVHEHGLGITGMAPTDLEYSPIRMVQPDLFVLPTHAGKLPANWHRLPEPLLAIEVLSPSTARHDRVTKREMYLEEGLHQYWVVDLHALVFERWRVGEDRAEVCAASIEWRPSLHAPTLTIDLPRYFADVHDPFPEGMGW